MNLRCKPILLIGIVFLSFFLGCVKDDENEDCTQGINIRFYTKTSCQTDTVYPSQINDIVYGVFDKNGVMVAHQQKENITFSKDMVEQIQVSTGLYTVIAWSGVDETHYDIKELQDGITTKDDLMFRLKRIQNHAYSLEGTHVYYGESPAVYVPDIEDGQSVFENVAINMHEITNRITISVEGLARLDEYQIDIESDNGSMNINGTIAEDEIIEYDPEPLSRDGAIESHFTMLKLEVGHTNTIVIKNTILNQELFRGSLLGSLLLKNPDVNLNCENDFTIRFTTRDECGCGTYTIAEIWVNNWLVHSYETEM